MKDDERRLLLALADKYRVIAHLRAQAGLYTAAEARLQMVSLARRFPGALRELDSLPDELIAARRQALALVLAADGVPERWMLLQASYHGFLRAALRLKRALAGFPGGVDPLGDPFEGLAYVAEEDEPSRDRLRSALSSIVRPPHGRLSAWVLAQVALDHAVTPDEVAGALFPERVPR